jgi:TonB family protein
MNFSCFDPKVRDDRAVKTLSLLKTLTLCCAVALAVLPSVAQRTQSDISARLVGKSLFLRGCWSDDKLKFDAAGLPAGRYATTSFTVAGMDVTRVSVSGDRLRLEGERMGLEFDSDGGMSRVEMMVGISPKTMSPEKMTVEIDGHGNKDFGPALDAIFSDGLADMVPSMPEMWQLYARTHFLPHQGEAEDIGSSRRRGVNLPGVGHIGGSVRPPKLVHNVEPEFSEDARRMKFSGNSQVYLWVDEQGDPGHVSVARPAGLGLDEEAVKCVSQYKFNPAMQNGNPVKVDLYVDVNFQVF